jgi:hypothetical protein
LSWKFRWIDQSAVVASSNPPGTGLEIHRDPENNPEGNKDGAGRQAALRQNLEVCRLETIIMLANVGIELRNVMANY